MRETTDEDPDERVAAAAVTVFTLLVAFGALALDVPYWWVAFPVGFGGLLPLVVALVNRRRATEFERRVERLLETETDADAAAYAERRAREREADRER